MRLRSPTNWSKSACSAAIIKLRDATRPRLRATPAWEMRALGLVNCTVREVNEMAARSTNSVVNASRAETELRLRATPFAVQQSVRRYRTQALPSAPDDPVRGR